MDLNKCIGTSIPTSDWIESWGDGSECYEIFFRELYESGSGPSLEVKLDPTKLPAYRSYADSIFRKYLAINKITEPGQVGYNNFQEVLHRWCRRLPGVCDVALTSPLGPCPGLSDPENRSKISKDRQLLKFCGCFSADDPLNTSNGISKECDPLCSRADTIPRLEDNPESSNYGNRKICNSDICVINDINITATNTYVAGGVGFAQLCNTCSSGNCKCIISVPDIQTTMSDIGITDNFVQVCGPTSSCQIIDPDNPQAPPKSVPCVESITTLKINPYTASIPAVVWFAIIAFVIVVCLLIVLSASYRSQTKLVIPGGVVTP